MRHATTGLPRFVPENMCRTTTPIHADWLRRTLQGLGEKTPVPDRWQGQRSASAIITLRTATAQVVSGGGQTGTADMEPPKATAQFFMTAGASRSADIHLFESDDGHHLFVANGSRLFDIKRDLFAELGAAISADRVGELLDRMGAAGPRVIDDQPLSPPPIHALSLAIAQKCNLGCTYCYAQQGEFGGAAKDMPLETANRAVDLLLSEAGDHGNAVLAFLGGEPLVNRPVVQAVTQRAAELARHRGIALSFSITTNGTLLNEGDSEFFETYGFAVTISLDGPREVHDRVRPYKSGAGSFDRIMRNVQPLLAYQRRMQVSARVTVTPSNLEFSHTLDDFIAAGFHSVGFSPMLSAPGGRGEMQADDLVRMLDGMIDCGRAFERRLAAGERYPFANMVNAMREIHRGTIGLIRAAPAPAISVCPPMASWRHVTASLATRRVQWAHSRAWIVICSRAGWPNATCIGRRRAQNAGRAICAAAAVITRRFAAAGRPATIFAAGCNIA